ncbi:MAG: TolC family protein [Cyclobacteriaceae bacterium]|nr:TolC family protein [Cyclobacteriaceae bacterium]
MLACCLQLVSYQAKAQELLPGHQQNAASNNPGLMAKYRNFEAAMQKVAQVNSLPDPSLSVGYFISPVETRVGPQQAKISLSQMFPWFGTLKTHEEATTLAAEARYQEYLDARNMLFYQVAEVYYLLYELNRLVALEKENIQILTSYKDIAKVKFEHGQSAMVDVLRVDIMLQDAVTNLSILKEKKKALESRFNSLLSRSADLTVEVQDTIQVEKVPTNYRRDSLWTSNPKLDELSLKIKANEAGERAAIKQGLPKIGLGLDYVFVGKRKDMMVEESGKNALMPMLTISLPIFRAKYNAAQNEARLMQESYTLQKTEMANTLGSQYDMAWFELQNQAALLALYEQQTQTSKQSLHLLFSAYSNSGKDFEEVLRMQQQLIKYRKMKASATSAFKIALAELDYITAKSK